MLALRAARVFTGSTLFTPGELVLDGDRVHSVGPPSAEGPRSPRREPPFPAPTARVPEVVDLDDVTLAPGLVDAHCHGGAGVAFPDDPDAVLGLHRAHGTTTMVASLVTQSLDDLHRQVRSLAPRVHAGDLAGIHLEGPWLAEEYRGAHPADKLRRPAASEVGALLDAGAGAVRMVTLAVERPGALEVVRLLAGRGVVAALGHSGCTHDQARTAIGAGITGATHLFNAMPALHHRDPGPVLALLADDRVWCELIADGVHVHPDLVAWVMRVCDRVVLVTDAMAAAGCGDGDFVLGDLPVEVRGSVARIAGTDTIAGSTLVLSRAVRVAIRAGVPFEAALRAATLNPARYLGLTGVGEFTPGARADAVAFGPDWAVERVLHGGEWV